MLLRVDKLLTEEALDHEKRQALYVHRKITVLRASTCCGMCGTTRYTTKPFWSLNMRVCSECLQANLVSHLVLYERYWQQLDRPVQRHPTFIDAVAGTTFYFTETVTAHQRLEYSSDRIDFPGGRKTLWFFWRPHLEKVVDMDLLAREAKAKHAAAVTVRAMARRCLVLRTLGRVPSGNRKCPTTMTSYSNLRKHRRTALARLRKTELLDRPDPYHEARVMSRMRVDLAGKLRRFVDRVTAFVDMKSSPWP